MSLTFPFARYGRAAAAIASAVLLSSSPQVLAQELNPAAAAPNAGTENSQAKAPGPMVRDIRVRGTQRIEPATVLSYISIRPGDSYDEQAVDRSLKSLFATGLFADVKINWDGSVLTINVVENPILNRVVFEGYS